MGRFSRRQFLHRQPGLPRRSRPVGWSPPRTRRQVRTGRRPGVRFGVRCPFKTKILRQRALLLQRLGYDGIELGPEFLDRSVDSILSDLKGTGIVVSAIVGSIKLLDPDPAERAKAVELDRKRLEMARALGAVAVIEVPTFGPCRFPEAAGTPGPHAVEDRLLIRAGAVDARRAADRGEDPPGAADEEGNALYEFAEPRCPDHRAIWRPMRPPAERLLPHAIGGEGHCSHADELRKIHRLRPSGRWREADGARFAAVRLSAWFQGAEEGRLLRMAHRGIGSIGRSRYRPGAGVKYLRRQWQES